MDIEGDPISVLPLPEPPAGMEISRVDVLIRLVAKGSQPEEE
jgi:hypothetical protein